LSWRRLLSEGLQLVERIGYPIGSELLLFLFADCSTVSQGVSLPMAGLRLILGIFLGIGTGLGIATTAIPAMMRPTGLAPIRSTAALHLGEPLHNISFQQRELTGSGTLSGQRFLEKIRQGLGIRRTHSLVRIRRQSIAFSLLLTRQMIEQPVGQFVL